MLLTNSHDASPAAVLTAMLACWLSPMAYTARAYELVWNSFNLTDGVGYAHVDVRAEE